MTVTDQPSSQDAMPGALLAIPVPAATAARLMAAYCDGDRRAFDGLYALISPRLLAYATSLVRSRATAEDLVQQTFIKLHRARATYVRGADPVPWVYTICHRACLDELRRQRRSRVRLVDGDDGPPEQAVDITGTLDGEPAGPEPELVARGLAALDRLPEKQRQAVLLTKIHGHSTAEAAGILGTSAGAVKLRAHRGYVALRKLLGSDAS